MKKNTKKKVLTLTLVIALLSIAVVGGSLAWFTAEDSATNTFTVGSIKIKQHEDFDEAGAKLLIPAVGDAPSPTNNYIKKQVTVENTGKNPAYIRTLVAVPAPLDNAGIVQLYDADHSTNGWEKVSGHLFTGITIDGETMTYNVYAYNYTTELAVGQTTDPCLEWVYINRLTDMEIEENAEGNITGSYFTIPDGNGGTLEVRNFDPLADKLNVYVLTQAVQSQGFSNVNTAMNNAFGATVPVFNAA